MSRPKPRRKSPRGESTNDLVFSAHVATNDAVFPQVLSLYLPVGSLIADVTFGTDRDLFGKRAPLRVSHDALAVGHPSSAEFAPRNQRRFRSSGIATLRAHDVGEVDPASLYLHQLLPGSRRRLRHGAHFQHIGFT